MPAHNNPGLIRNGDAASPPPTERHSYKYLSFSAPYLELIEEMTLTEFLQFHQAFKPFLSGHSIPEIIVQRRSRSIGRETDPVLFFRHAKQKVKLAQAIFSDTPAVLLDEPCTNLDTQGVEVFTGGSSRITHCPGRLVIVSSNDRQEYDFCGAVINIMDYKMSTPR